MRFKWHKQRQKGHFCVSAALNESLQYKRGCKLIIFLSVNAKRLLVIDCQLSELVAKDENREGSEDVKAWQVLKVLYPFKDLFLYCFEYFCAGIII